MDTRKLFFSSLAKEFRSLVAEDISHNYTPISSETAMQTYLQKVPNVNKLNVRILARAFFLFITRKEIDEKEMAHVPGISPSSISNDKVEQLLSLEAKSLTTNQFRSISIFSTEDRESKIQLIEAIYSYYSLLVKYTNTDRT